MPAISVESPNSGTRQFTNSDGTTFTQTGGTLAWRNNNPGNLIYGSFAESHGAIGEDPNGFAIFPDYNTGQAALQSLVTTTYGSSTINSMMQSYAPSFENDTQSYQAFISDRVGVSGTTTISNLTSAQVNALVNAITTYEGTSPGTLTGTYEGPAPSGDSSLLDAPDSDSLGVDYSTNGAGNFVVSFQDNTTTLDNFVFDQSGNFTNSILNGSGGVIETIQSPPNSSVYNISLLASNLSINGGNGNNVSLGSSLSGDTITSTSDQVTFASGVQATIDGVGNAVSLATNSALTLGAGATGNTATVNGTGASVNMAAAGGAVAGDTVTFSGSQENLAFGTIAKIDVSQGDAPTVTGTNGTMTINNDATGGAIDNTINWNAGGSQGQFFNGIPGNAGEEVTNYAGANLSGTLNDVIYDWTAGGSQTDLYSGLGSGIAEEILDYSQANTTGADLENVYNYTAGNSTTDLYSGLGSGIAEEILDYSQANTSGADLENIYNYTAGGSQTDLYSGLGSGIAEEVFDYSGANTTGADLENIYNYTSGGSQTDLYSGLGGGISEEILDYSEANTTGADLENIFNYTVGGSITDLYSGLGSGISEEAFNYSGANTTGTLNAETFDWTAGGSQEQLYTGLPNGDKEIVDDFAGANDTGTLQNTIWDYNDNASEVEWFNPNSSISTEIGNYTGLNGSGTDSSNTLNFTAGGSQYQQFTGLSGGATENLDGYSGANLSGSEKYTLTDYSNDTSLYYVIDPSTGVSGDYESFSGLNGSGKLTQSNVDNTNNTSIDITYDYNGSGVETGTVDTFYSGSTDLGQGVFSPTGAFQSGSYDPGSRFAADDQIIANDTGGYGYGGYYGMSKPKKNATMGGTNIGVIAQYDSNQANDPAAAAAAEAGQMEISFLTQLQAAGSTLVNSPFYEDAKWSSKVVTWSLADTPGTIGSPFSGYIGQEYDALVQQAFGTWSAASGLTFEQVSDSSQSDIRLGWGDFNTSSSGVIGYTSYQYKDGQFQPNVIVRLEDPSQDALITGPNNTLTYSGTESSLYQVMLHEIGHALGLADNADPNSIMYYQTSASNDTPDSNDTAGMKALYGPTASLSFAPLVSEAALNSMIQQMNQAAATFHTQEAAASSFVPPEITVPPPLTVPQHI